MVKNITNKKLLEKALFTLVSAENKLKQYAEDDVKELIKGYGCYENPEVMISGTIEEIGETKRAIERELLQLERKGGNKNVNTSSN